MSRQNKLTKDNMNFIREYLIEVHGAISPSWNVILELLENNLDLYTECRKSVALNGLYDANTGKKNPLLTTMKDLQATILKQIQHLGLSPYAQSKIKLDESEEDDFIDDLTK